jgi:hypothetical protein
MNFKKIAVAVALALGAPISAHAVLIDPDGAGPASAVNVGSLDWTQTSFLAQGGQTAIANFTSGACVATPSLCQFTILTMANLGNFVATDGTTNIQNTGLGTNYQWTMVASFTETVTGVLGDIATFSTVPSIPGNLEIFYDTNLNANALTGSGFNDGRLILQGTAIQNASGNFQVTDSTPVPLDGFGANDYTGQNTVSGTGSNTSIGVGGLTTDPAFFLGALSTFGISFQNVSIGLPYGTTDPSDCFQQGSTGTAVGSLAAGTPQCANIHVNGLMSANSPDVNGGYVPNIGVVNGLFGNTAPDFMAQTDFNSPLVARVPEPMTLGLLGIGLAAMGWSTRRKQR